LKLEQKIVLVYTIFAALLGIATNYLLKNGFDLIISLGSPFVIYFVSLLLLTTLIKEKKSRLFYNSFITFILVWLTVWVLLYNI
jgi:hypothetical protein